VAPAFRAGATFFSPRAILGRMPAAQRACSRDKPLGPSDLGV